MDNKIKMLYVMSTLRRCGPVNSLYNIVRYLNQDVFEATILTLSPECDDSRENDFILLGVKIYKLNLSRLEMMIYGSNKFGNLIKSLLPDIVHSSGIRADNYSLSCKNNYQLCSTIRNYPHLDYPLLYGSFIGQLMARKHLALIKKIKFAIACSEAIAEELQSRFGISVPYIRNGVDIGKFKKVDFEAKIALRKKLNIPQHTRILICVGSFIQRKNTLLVIESFFNSKLVNNSILLMVGDGPLYNEYRKYQSDKAYFIGKVSNVIEYLNAADVFISASKAEGLPNAVLEAMAVGLPVILSDIKPHREIIDVNPNVGTLFTLENKKDLIEKLDQFDFNKLNFMSSEAVKSIEENFTAEITSRLYQDYYLMMVNGHK